MPVCAHPRCTALTRSDEFACRKHWYQLPHPLRNEIWSGWNLRKRTGDAAPHRRAMATAMAWYADRVREVEAGGGS